MITFDQTTGDNADNARMPASSGEDNGVLSCSSGFHLGNRFRENLLLNALPLTIKTVKETGQLLRPQHIAGEEEFDPQAGILETAGGIEAGSEAESDIAAGDLTNPGDLAEGFQSGTTSAIVPRATRSRL